MGFWGLGSSQVFCLLGVLGFFLFLLSIWILATACGSVCLAGGVFWLLELF